MTKRLLITGAAGLVGKAVYHGLSVNGALRICGEMPSCIKPLVVGEICGVTGWGNALCDVNIAVHLAAHVHVMHDTEVDPLTAFRIVNVKGALNLASQAAAAGANRFVFVSSVKVNGEHSLGRRSLKPIHPTCKMPTARVSMKPSRFCVNSAPTPALVSYRTSLI